ncbi:MGDG synthase family glycosyltransferase [Rummeliibacillus suwonensis]|uniref:MGDG synthase family glycosyltransferase n=1 Tax=Rummeliibacillus suwonensis TaxID=1306154 RepID=UPI0011B5DC43|nr:galactosyldiacylglycerol synthase [Rummeliibacillus suwonensis]MBO2536089.1 galactosyldiacylglycerol synthase [Rummeliibacillus suwonensis]
MKKILFLPLLQMQSGHHQVADALMDMLKIQNADIVLKKIDIMSYSNQTLEKIISTNYLKWIKLAPESYDFVYKKRFYSSNPSKGLSRFYEKFFVKKMHSLMTEEKPDVIVCTHGFPSYLISKLKAMGKCDIPVINAYTDFFVNNVWAKEGIDLHFVPSREVKENLIAMYDVPSEKIIVTGIPVHKNIMKVTHRDIHTEKPKILIAGGNSGLGGILKLSAELKKIKQFQFIVLCGNNKKLYDEITSWQIENIKPLPYISSREKMNELYDAVDAIMTKPGGVTISEALRKRLPIFVHSYLPGQEKINLTYLKEHQLVFEMDQTIPLEIQLKTILKNTEKMKQWEQAIDVFQQEIEMDTPNQLVDVMNWILDKKTNRMPLQDRTPSIHLRVARV